MKRINCIVQEHKFSKDDIRKMESGFRAIYRENYSEEPLKVFWMIFPKGSAFAERQPSNGTIILIEVNDDISTPKREELMGLFSNFLFENYNVSPLDTVITVANSSWVNRFYEAQQKRISPLYRPWFTIKTLWTALTSKWTNGFLRLRVKY